MARLILRTAAAAGKKYRRREYSVGERINWEKLLGYDAVPEYCFEGVRTRAPIEELRCNWPNKKLGLPHENDLVVGRSVGRSRAFFPRIGGRKKICR